MNRLRTLLVAVMVASSASAAELDQGRLFLNGYGSAAFGRTDGNSYGFASEEGEYEARFALAAISRAYEDVVLGASIELSSEGEMEIDWAFAEWRLSDAIRLRAGQSKHAFGLYAETQDVGTVRPFYGLPTSVYGPGGFSAESYIGAGATGALRGGAWGLEYDVYGGELRAEVVDLDALLQPGAIPAPAEEEVDLMEELVGGRLTLLAPVRGLSLRFSAYRARREEAGDTGVETSQVVFGPAVEYQTDATWVRAEYYHLTQGDETADAGYLEAARFLCEHVQLAARVEAYRSAFEGLPSSSFLRHTEVALGANYWVNPDTVFKASVHAVDGNRFALPELVGPDEAPEQRTWGVLVGAQFTF